jgi:hypothetical protein
MKKIPLKNIPSALILVIIWTITRLMEMDFSIAHPLGIILMILCFAVLIFEFTKSGDITLKSFGLDLAFAILATVFNTATLTILIQRHGFCNLFITDYILAGVILCDTWLSPYNSFRIALRNFMVGDAQHTGT